MDLQKYRDMLAETVQVECDGQTWTLRHPPMEAALDFEVEWRLAFNRAARTGKVKDEEGNWVLAPGSDEDEGQEMIARAVPSLMAKALSYTLNDGIVGGDLELMLKIIVSTGGLMSPLGETALRLCGIPGFGDSKPDEEDAVVAVEDGGTSPLM